MSIQIVEIKPYHVKGKRLCATLSDGTKYNFGAEHGHTYIDRHDLTKRSNQRTRRFGSPKEKPLLEHLIPSPSVLAYYILWGPYETIEENIQYLNKLWRKKALNSYFKLNKKFYYI